MNPLLNKQQVPTNPIALTRMLQSLTPDQAKQQVLSMIQNGQINSNDLENLKQQATQIQNTLGLK